VKRLLATCAVLWLAAGFGRAANSTVGELLSALKAQPAGATNWILIPVAGSTIGRDGIVFHTELALSATPDYYSDARVAVAWLPFGREASEDPVRHMTIPSEFDASFTLYRDGLASPGFGALVVAVVDGDGALVTGPNVQLRGEIRVWSLMKCGGEASFSYHPGRTAGLDIGALNGLTLGGGFRSNVGIVNADTEAHTWRVRYGALDGSEPTELVVTVPAASSRIVGLPPLVSGPITVGIESESAGVPWTAWGASVDNASDDSWYAPLGAF